MAAINPIAESGTVSPLAFVGAPSPWAPHDLNKNPPRCGAIEQPSAAGLRGLIPYLSAVSLGPRVQRIYIGPVRLDEADMTGMRPVTATSLVEDLSSVCRHAPIVSMPLSTCVTCNFV